jgi:hypothetical protein
MASHAVGLRWLRRAKGRSLGRRCVAEIRKTDPRADFVRALLACLDRRPTIFEVNVAATGGVPEIAIFPMESRAQFASFAIEHHNRLKTIFVVVSIEEPQLLAAMHRIKRVVDVENDALGNLPKRLAIQIDHGAAHAQ